jgi:hypothetical protein
VDLRNRRTRQRLLVDPRERVRAELLVDRAPDLLERHRRGVVDELRELVDVDVRKQVRPRREQLAELA